MGRNDVVKNESINKNHFDSKIKELKNNTYNVNLNNKKEIKNNTYNVRLVENSIDSSLSKKQICLIIFFVLLIYLIMNVDFYWDWILTKNFDLEKFCDTLTDLFSSTGFGFIVYWLSDIANKKKKKYNT